MISKEYNSFSNGSTVKGIVSQLRSMAIDLLARMYRREERLFAFRLRRNGKGEVLEGISRRYTAMALIGLTGEDHRTINHVLGGHSLEDVCGYLLENIEASNDLGEVALITWAARAVHHKGASHAITALRQMQPAHRDWPTVELSWALTALVADGCDTTDMNLADEVASALLASYRQETGLFGRWSAGGKIKSKLRGHVRCFADFVYPIQALSYYHQATGNTRAAEVACSSAERMCQLQGPQGQWWWHFDNRTGRVIEHYPVYSVHQDSMAPMALSALVKMCGQDYSDAIEKGLRWLANPTEITEELVDTERNVIWRKVARREPAKLVRSLQAAASCLHSGIRIPMVDMAFPAVSIDYECRPYHMGWILHAWPTDFDRKTDTQPSRFPKTMVSNPNA